MSDLSWRNLFRLAAGAGAAKIARAQQPIPTYDRWATVALVQGDDRRKNIHDALAAIEEQIKPGVVDWPAVQKRLREQGIVLVGGGADEAPEVYKRLPDVLAAHGDTIWVKRTLRPLGVAMAGRDVHDPYKD